MATMQAQQPQNGGQSEPDFQDVIAQFLAHLSDSERQLYKTFEAKNFQDSSQFIEDFQKLGNMTRNKKFPKILSAVSRFSHRLNPYFSILDMIAQSCPQWTAIAWGAFRIVLQLAVNFTSFFEKLSDLLGAVSKQMPAYAEVLQLKLAAPSDRLRSSIRGFYLDLFELFTAVVRVFTQKSGKLKKTPVVIGQLLWQPFDVRFGNFVSRLQFHDKIVRREIVISHWKDSRAEANEASIERSKQEVFRVQAQQYFDLQSAMKQEFTSMHQESLVERTRAWINPPCFAEPFERALKARQEGTSAWLFGRGSFVDWAQNGQNPKTPWNLQRVFWLQGNPGAGKTVLTASTVEFLESSSSRPNVYYFFFEKDAAGMSRAGDAYRSLLAQILYQWRHDMEVVDMFSVSMSAPRSGQITATESELIELLSTVLARIDDSYIVIDGMDECDKPDDLVRTLFETMTVANASMLISSRPNVEILRRRMKGTQIVVMDRACVHQDLQLYFRHSLNELQELALLPDDADHNDLIDHLVLGADGMFQWASVMVAYLRSRAMTPKGRLQVITSLKTPERLDKMYFRTLTLIAGHHFEDEQILAKKIFLWLIFQKRTLRAQELQDIVMLSRSSTLDHPSTYVDADEAETAKDFEHMAVLICASLVELRQDGRAMLTYRFIHRSVYEFFLSKCTAPEARNVPQPGSLEFFFPPVHEAEALLTTDSLAYIVRRIPKKPLSGNMFQQATKCHLESLPPFLGYACLHWPSHIAKTVQPPPTSHQSVSLSFASTTFTDVLKELTSFFEDKLVPMSWLETIYSLQKRPTDLYYQLQKWVDLTARLKEGAIDESLRDVPAAVSAFASDMAYLHQLWGDTLQKGPHQIWNDVTAFTLSPFLIKTSAVSVKTLLADSVSHKSLSSQPLSRISRDAAESDLLATLTIWPSRDFELQFKKNRFKDLQKISDRVIAGWMIQYQLWDLEPEDPAVVETYMTPIEQDEVALQLQRFTNRASELKLRRRTSKHELALHFPSGISKDLNTFTVLRTLFRKVPGRNHPEHEPSNTFVWISVPVPVSHSSHPMRDRFGQNAPPNESSESKQEGESPSDVALDFESALAYKISTFDDYVLYESFEGDTTSDLFSEGIEAATTLAVFQIQADAWSHEIIPLGIIKGDITRFSGHVRLYAFHPSLALMAFYIFAPFGKDKVVMWSFDSDRISKQTPPVFLTFYSLSRNPSCISWDLKGNRVLQTLQFSASGKELVFAYSFEPRPIVLPIETTPPFVMAQQNAAKVIRHSEARQDEVATILNSTEIVKTLAALPHAVNQGDIILHGASSSTKLNFDPQARDRDVQLSFVRGGQEVQQSILSLPKWTDVQNVKVSLRMPTKTRSDKIRIILNKSAKTFYTYTRDSEEAHPAVVDKDLRALPPVSKRALPIKRPAEVSSPSAAGSLPGSDWLSPESAGGRATKIPRAGPEIDFDTMLADDDWTDLLGNG